MRAALGASLRDSANVEEHPRRSIVRVLVRARDIAFGLYRGGRARWDTERRDRQAGQVGGHGKVFQDSVRGASYSAGGGDCI